MIRIRLNTAGEKTDLISTDPVATFDPSASAAFSPPTIISEFDNPFLELVRLLHESSEVEQALMVQYLYAVFSVKDNYPVIHGFPIGSSGTLLGVAVQEMVHLDSVNQFLLALGASPNLQREDFPWESQIYPFPLNLEPLSRESLAKYVFTEAPAGVFDPNSSEYDAALSDEIGCILGADVRINHVGSLYARIIELANEVNTSKPASVADLSLYIGRMELIKGEGEVGHFQFFRDVFRGTHVGFNGVLNPWQLPQADPKYPSLPLPRNPSVFKDTISDSKAKALGRVANIHYWLILTMLDAYYRYQIGAFLTLAKSHMTGPLLGLGNILASSNHGVPFDVLDLGYSPAISKSGIVLHCLRLLDEADAIINANIGSFAGFNNGQSQTTRTKLDNI